jgi:hypothetical protein
MMNLLRNVVHRHEPPVTSTPVKVLLHDENRQFIVVDKPGSIVRPSRLLPCLPWPHESTFVARARFWSVLPQLLEGNSD